MGALPLLELAERSATLPTLRQLTGGGGGEAAPLRQGWLLKEGALLATFRRWQRRWCVLVPGSLYYFKNKSSDERAAGVIKLDGALLRVLNSDFHFEVVTPRRAYLLRIDRAEEGGAGVLSSLFGEGGAIAGAAVLPPRPAGRPTIGAEVAR